MAKVHFPRLYSLKESVTHTGSAVITDVTIDVDAREIFITAPGSTNNVSDYIPSTDFGAILKITCTDLDTGSFGSNATITLKDPRGVLYLFKTVGATITLMSTSPSIDPHGNYYHVLENTNVSIE
jgi:hypothetical protein